MAELEKGPKNALATVEPDRKDVALEIMSPQQREWLLGTVAEQLSLVVAAEQPKEGDSQKTPDPRILRLLNALDPVLYKALKDEMAATITLIASPTTDPEMKAALQEEMKRTIEARLGPAFSHIAFAVGLLSGDDFCLNSVSAAVEDLSNTIVETPPETKFLGAARALIALKALRITTDKSLEGIKAFVIQYVLKEIETDGCRGNIEKCYSEIRFDPGKTHTDYEAYVVDADYNRFVDNLERLCASIGLKVRIKVAPECTSVRDDKFVKQQLRKVFIHFDFENPPLRTALEKR